MRRRMIHDIGTMDPVAPPVIVGINQTNGDFLQVHPLLHDRVFFHSLFFPSLPFFFKTREPLSLSLSSVEEDFLETSFPNKGKYQILQRGNVRRVKCLRDRITRSIPWFKFVVTRVKKLLIGFPLVFVDIALPNLASFFFFFRGRGAIRRGCGLLSLALITFN